MGFFKKKKKVKSSLTPEQGNSFFINTVKKMMRTELSSDIIKHIAFSKDTVTVDVFEIAMDRSIKLMSKMNVNLVSVEQQIIRELTEFAKKVNEETIKKYVFVTHFTEYESHTKFLINAKIEGYIKEDSIDSYLSAIDSINE